MSQKKPDKQNKTALKRELKDFDRLGIPLILNGYPSSPGKIAKSCCLAEEGTYMRERDIIGTSWRKPTKSKGNH